MRVFTTGMAAGVAATILPGPAVPGLAPAAAYLDALGALVGPEAHDGLVEGMRSFWAGRAAQTGGAR